MNSNKDEKFDCNSEESLGSVVDEIVTDISSKVQKNYEMIDLSKVPHHVNYSKVEKYLRSINVEITRKMFLSYINEGLLPGGHEVKNANFSYYTKEQIIYYILVDMFKPILPHHDIKILFDTTLNPMIDDKGIESTYKMLDSMIRNMGSKFEEAVTIALKENTSTIKDIGLFANLVTLCMSKGALDFYKYSPK